MNSRAETEPNKFIGQRRRTKNASRRMNKNKTGGAQLTQEGEEEEET
jgi:hypothetical protein